ncbi:ATPase associated with various cellular activities, AAA_3 [Euzebya pacifica]|uniref:ATPase associated with various cellular activities, AAA_3 n=1 Tax=Euzebya pacifica TaxID=1608957 RepID=A0A346XSP9_9ACTN|nr:AAA family ATPase [Euzebya pacifica]AXV05246.1 ATPase associated with various cellular activities, AAA_3 [Euzebya pacifica]
MDRTRLQHVAQAPTNPRHARPDGRAFDVADLYTDGPLPVDSPADAGALPLDEKLRQAYFWIVNRAVISPHYDLDFHDGPSPSWRFGESATEVTLPSGQSYSSFVLLPLLNFAVRARCLLVGGPGRGKTATATLLGVLAGYSLTDVRRGMQHGHPQMTIADLLGNPLPADLVSATSTTDIRIAWRSWLDMRVRIVDEYNRIPTRTQSALLTLMGDGYAEMLDQVKECPEGAWFLTANDDAGGGTYKVIEALRDRIDVTVKALAFNPRFLGALLDRIEAGYRPAELVPEQLVFTSDEHDRMHAEILAVPVPDGIRRRLEFFASQFEFAESAATVLEYQTKDTIRLSGIQRHLLDDDTGTDRLADLGVQTLNGLSVRALMTIMTFAKAMAWFRGMAEVQLDDVRHVLGFVLHDRLVPDLDAPFFEAEGNAALRADRVGWIRRLFDLSCADYDRQGRDTDDPVSTLLAEFDAGIDGLTEAVTRERLTHIEGLLASWAKGKKLYGTVYDDVLALKYLHQRYTNYLAWLQWRG